MKNSLFVRPNLKLFLLGALGLVLAHDLFFGSPIQASARTLPVVGKRGYVTEEELTRLRSHVLEFPSADGYFLLSYCYKERGDYQKAMSCLIAADRFVEFD